LNKVMARETPATPVPPAKENFDQQSKQEG